MEKEQANMKVKKIVNVILSVLTYLFFFICIISLILSVLAKKDPDGAVSVFGKQMRIVLSDSMAKCDQTDVSDYEIKDIPVKSMVFIDLMPEDEKEKNEWLEDLEENDVLTFRYVYVQQETITHRIKSITENKNGGFTIVLEGDNKSSDSNILTQTIDTSEENSPNYVIGKVTGQSYFLGLLVTAIKSPVGIICIIILPALIIAILAIIKLVDAFNSKKKEKAQAEEQKKDEELDELRRKIKLLEEERSASANDSKKDD